MKILFIVPILACFTKVAFVSSFECDPLYDCQTNNGNAVPDPLDCTKYYNCFENPPGSSQYFPAVPSMKCPAGTHFDQSLQFCNIPGDCTNACCEKCNYQTEISCNSDNSSTGEFFAVPCTQRLYYNCVLGPNGPPSVYKCPDGTCFDRYAKFCVISSTCSLPAYCTSCPNCFLNIATTAASTLSTGVPNPTTEASISTTVASTSTTDASTLTTEASTSITDASTSTTEVSISTTEASTLTTDSSTTATTVDGSTVTTDGSTTTTIVDGSTVTTDVFTTTTTVDSSTSTVSSTTTIYNPCQQTFICPMSEGNFRNCDYCDHTYWHCSGYQATLSSCGLGYVFNTDYQYPFCLKPDNCPFP